MQSYSNCVYLHGYFPINSLPFLYHIQTLFLKKFCPHSFKYTFILSTLIYPHPPPPPPPPQKKKIQWKPFIANECWLFRQRVTVHEQRKKNSILLEILFDIYILRVYSQK